MNQRTIEIPREYVELLRENPTLRQRLMQQAAAGHQFEANTSPEQSKSIWETITSSKATKWILLLSALAGVGALHYTGVINLANIPYIGEYIGMGLDKLKELGIAAYGQISSWASSFWEWLQSYFITKPAVSPGEQAVISALGSVGSGATPMVGPFMVAGDLVRASMLAKTQLAMNAAGTVGQAIGGGLQGGFNPFATALRLQLGQ